MTDPAPPDQRGRSRPRRGGGLPTLPTGEPVLHRWFVIAMLLLVPVAIAVTAWAFLSVERDELTPAERRPPGGPEVTIERGAAQLVEDPDAEPGPDCAQAIRIHGDRGALAAGRRALSAACELLATGAFPEATEGLRAWARADGVLRIAAFEFSGVESSARLEDGRLVVELNAKFQFEDATRAAPALLHQLTLLADPDFPGQPITAERELLGAQVQLRACEALDLPGPQPRGCRDAEELLAADDPVGMLVDAGYERQ